MCLTWRHHCCVIWSTIGLSSWRSQEWERSRHYTIGIILQKLYRHRDRHRRCEYRRRLLAELPISWSISIDRLPTLLDSARLQSNLALWCFWRDDAADHEYDGFTRFDWLIGIDQLIIVFWWSQWKLAQRFGYTDNEHDRQFYMLSPRQLFFHDGLKMLNINLQLPGILFFKAAGLNFWTCAQIESTHERTHQWNKFSNISLH